MALRFNDFLREEIEFEDELVNELSGRLLHSVAEHKTETIKNLAGLLKVAGNPEGKFMRNACEELFEEYNYWMDTERARGKANV